MTVDAPRAPRRAIRRKRTWTAALGAGVAATLALGGCGGSQGPTPAGAAPAPATPGFTPTECGTYSGTGCAPAVARIDLAKPVFSNPTRITNPLFPISRLSSAVLLGRVDGLPFRSETTLLPQPVTVRWDGMEIATLASQYMAYRNGRIEEVALDRYAQADDGSVWYFGEDVVDYRAGRVATSEGTWLAGVEGPPAMIMPAAPRVGDVFRTENVLGIVFEEVTINRTGVTVNGPSGPVTGAITARELHLDGSFSEKTFAPGYGEFLTGNARELEALALAAPADALPGLEPPQLERLLTSVQGMLGSVRAGDWEAARATLRRMRADWTVLRGQRPPTRIAGRMDVALAALTRAVSRHEPASATQAAIDAGQSVLDLRLRHLPPAQVDRGRLELWCQQVPVHAAARDNAGVRGDVATIEWIRDRITGTLDPVGLAEVDRRIAAARGAADAGRAGAAADHAVRLALRLRSL